MFHDASNAKENIQLLSFQPFQDTADAVAAITACQEGKVSSSLQQFLTKRIKKLLKKSSSDYSTLAIADKALAVNIKQDILATTDSSSKMKVVNDDKTAEIFRGIRCYMDDLLGDTTADGDDTNASGTGLSSSDMHKMQLGLSHSLGRYKLKFSADKVDTMIIQAVGLLDELDKEINTYAMRVKVRIVHCYCGVCYIHISFWCIFSPFVTSTFFRNIFIIGMVWMAFSRITSHCVRQCNLCESCTCRWTSAQIKGFRSFFYLQQW